MELKNVMESVIVTLMLVLALAVVTGAQQMDSRVVEEKIYCSCGCGEILVNCHCETAVSMRTQIQNRLMAGTPPETIIKDFVTLYGSTILVNEDTEKIKVASKSSGFDMFPMYVLGIVVAAFVAYHLGKSSSRSKIKESWKLERKGGKK